MSEPKTIDLTPTWSGLVPLIALVLRTGNAEGRAQVTTELRQMAQAADNWNAYCDSQKEKTDG